MAILYDDKSKAIFNKKLQLISDILENDQIKALRDTDYIINYITDSNHR